MDDCLDELSRDQAIDILRRLAAQDEGIAQLVRDAVVAAGEAQYPDEVDPHAVAEGVADVMQGVTAEDIWDGSGSDRYGGYVEPTELADELIRETLEADVAMLEGYRNRGQHEQERLYCAGIIWGGCLYFEQAEEITADWCGEAVREAIRDIYDDWRKANPDPASREALEAYLQENCPGCQSI